MILPGMAVWIAAQAAAHGSEAERFFNQTYGPNSILNSPWLTVILVVGFFGGLASFWKGLGIYRKFRVAEDIPRITARSVAMGTVQVAGKAEGETTEVSPVTRTPCLFYRVTVDRWSRDDGTSYWKKPGWIRERVVDNGPPFFLDDGTGRVAVDLHGADFQMEPSGDCEMDPVSAYAAAAGSADLVSRDAIGGESSLGERCRLTEFLILPGKEYDVIGMCGQNPHSQDESVRNLIRKGADTFLVSDQSGRTLQIDLKHQAAAKVFGGAIMAVACLAVLLGQFRLI